MLADAWGTSGSELGTHLVLEVKAGATTPGNPVICMAPVSLDEEIGHGLPSAVAVKRTKTGRQSTALCVVCNSVSASSPLGSLALFLHSYGGLSIYIDIPGMSDMPDSSTDTAINVTVSTLLYRTLTTIGRSQNAR